MILKVPGRSVRRSRGTCAGYYVSFTKTRATSFAFTQRLVDVGVDPSVGSVGDGYDNALAETTIGLYKTELINPQRPWKTLDEVEFATLEWVDWYNNARLHSACERLPPAEYEANHLAAQT